MSLSSDETVKKGYKEMEKQELLKKIKYYKIKTDKKIMDFIKNRLVSIYHEVKVHPLGNTYNVYHLKEIIPYGSRSYKGSKVYYIYSAILEAMENAKQNGIELRAEARDMKNNPEKYASDEDLKKIFNCVGKSGLV